MLQGNVQYFARLPKSEEIQCSDKKVSEIEVLKSLQDQNYAEMSNQDTEFMNDSY